MLLAGTICFLVNGYSLAVANIPQSFALRVRTCWISYGVAYPDFWGRRFFILGLLSLDLMWLRRAEPTALGTIEFNSF